MTGDVVLDADSDRVSSYFIWQPNAELTEMEATSEVKLNYGERNVVSSYKIAHRKFHGFTN